MECLTETRTIDGATLVSVVVENPHEEPARYRVENQLDGRVCPPRRRGYPEAGWDVEGYEGVLAPGQREALGYAVFAEPTDPPARIAWTEPAPSTTRPTEFADVTRSFADPRPPRDVLSAVPASSTLATADGDGW